ncbi:MAG: hypothetical protein ACRDXC_12575, partial [Acidimicrobiales bacterium]
GDPRTLHPYEETQRAAGADLRDALGDGYVVIAMTIGSGAAPLWVPKTTSSPATRDFRFAAIRVLERTTRTPSKVRRLVREVVPLSVEV